MGWRIVYIENAMSVKLYLDNIKIIKDTNEVTIPLSDIHTLVIDNQMITITVPLINKCSENNINLIICNIEHLPQSIINPYSGNYQYPIMLKKQIEWDEDIKLLLHQKIIKNKILNQSDLLKSLFLNQDVINRIVGYSFEVKPGDFENREGLAAKTYFRELFGKNFKRFEDDPINAGLNYGYSILRSQISKTLIAKGLTPCIGIIHRGAINPFNLSDDIIEVFRPIIDEFVYKFLKETVILTRQNRLDIIKITGNDAYIKSKRQTIFNTISIYIDSIIKVFETNDINYYEEVHLIHEL